MSFEKQLVSCEKPLCCHIVTRLNLPCVYEKKGLLQLDTVQIFKNFFPYIEFPKMQGLKNCQNYLEFTSLHTKHQ